MSAPAAFASSALASFAITATLTTLPVPAGKTTEPRTIWSACLGSTFNFNAISTVSLNLAEAKVLTVSIASLRL